jgi:hypothetical protein
LQIITLFYHILSLSGANNDREREGEQGGSGGSYAVTAQSECIREINVYSDKINVDISTI